MTSFEDGVSQLFIRLEELKRSLVPLVRTQEEHDNNDDQHDKTSMVLTWRNDLDTAVQQLDFLLRFRLDFPADDVKADLYKHCRQRVLDTSKQVLEHVTQPKKKSVQDFEDMEGQGAIARMAELALMVAIHMNDGDQQEPQQQTTTTEDDEVFAQDIMDQYAAYQRAVLRQRSKPAIAQLATWRKQQQQQAATNRTAIVEEEDAANQNPHSNCITVVLGQASALIHPLGMWQQHVPPNSIQDRLCRPAVKVLDEQAQTLTKTISDWFWDDRSVEEWMKMASDHHTPSEHDNGHQKNAVDLAELDSLVEEMAFCTQVFARYQTLMEQQQDSYQPMISQEIIPEWNWKYATLERFLGREQWKSALALATPVHILVGSAIKVPSVVEDAQYLSTRALERATSTRSTLALGTVAHSLSHDIWSTEMNVGGVHQALLDQVGCWAAEEKKAGSNGSRTLTSPPKSSSSTFASALLDALDDDLGKSGTGGVPAVPTPPRQSSRPGSAPTSGGVGLFASLGGVVSGGNQQAKLQIKLETQLCALNGVFSASISSAALAESLQAWLAEDEEEGDGGNGSAAPTPQTTTSKETSMIQLAREELERYTRAYQELMEYQAKSILIEYCGHFEDMMSRREFCIHALRDYFITENFGVGPKDFETFESDARLDRILLTPLKESMLLSQLDKCDPNVTILLCRELTKLLAATILHALWDHQEVVSSWGSLLLSKQVRVVQTHVQQNLVVPTEDGLAPPSFLGEWEKLSQVVTILQLERPSDWSLYMASSVLTPKELKQTMTLRKDFSVDAIASMCSQQEESQKRP